MTTDIEKEFFKVFKIEPKNKCGKDLIYPNCLNPDKCGYDNCLYYQIEYPEITDRILLELICIANKANIEVIGETVEETKNKLLEEMIYWKDDIIYKQIQQLFKGEYDN